MAAIPINSLSSRPLVADNGTSYRPLQRIGGGGNGDVFLVMANDGQNRGNIFAAKLFARIDNETRLGRFKQEIDFLRNNPHPSILGIIDSGTLTFTGPKGVGDYPFAVFEYLPYTLKQAIRKGLSMTDKVVFALQLLSALDFLETRTPKVIHRDIKPVNIFVRGKSCILGDFGLIKILAGGDDATDHEFYKQTIEQSVMEPTMPLGHRTPDLLQYFRDGTPLTTQTDIFQLGLVLTELFSGRNPLRWPEKITDPIVLDDIDSFPCYEEERIKGYLKLMLEMKPNDRPTASVAIDEWIGVFNSVMQMSLDLEGQIFP